MKLSRNLLILALCFGLMLVFTVAGLAYNEAPMLQEKVNSGDLPSVVDRLPEEPKVVEPVDQIGQYGGIWERVTMPNQFTGFWRITMEGLVRWDPRGQKVEPNVAKDWEVNEDASEWTFLLRKGMKWSDGEPLTAEDFTFRYEHVTLNEQLAPQWASWFVEGEPVKIEAIDDYTVKFTFPQPRPLAHTEFAVGQGGPIPVHYAKNYHPAFVDKEELNDMADEEGFEDWIQLFIRQMQPEESPEIVPTLGAWQYPAVRMAGATRIVIERNPYYWKVDPEGNQLPYLDAMGYVQVENSEVLLMKAISGNIDMTQRYLSFSDYPLLAKNKENGNYDIYEWSSSISTFPILFPNHNKQGDQVMQDLMQNLKFRQALSYGINREEINQLVFYGMGKPWQAGVVKHSPFFEKEFATRYIEYDPQKANQLLDEIGLTERDAEGYRLRPDGDTLQITLSFYTGTPTESFELIKKHWEDLGIKLIINPTGGTNLFQSIPQAKEDMTARAAMDRSLRPDIDPLWHIPTSSQSWAFPKYGAWANKADQYHDSGIKPPEDSDYMKAINLYKEVQLTADDEKRTELMKEILDIVTRNVWIIGAVGNVPEPVLVKKNFKNVPQDLQTSWLIRSPANANPEQFYKVQE